MQFRRLWLVWVGGAVLLLAALFVFLALTSAPEGADAPPPIGARQPFPQPLELGRQPQAVGDARRLPLRAPQLDRGQAEQPLPRNVQR
jgi:hypothetical protein